MIDLVKPHVAERLVGLVGDNVEGFVGTIALAKFLLRGEVIEP